MFETSGDYRKVTICKLVEFTNQIVASLLENVYSFPKPISWIVYQISKIIEKSFSLKQVWKSLCLLIIIATFRKAGFWYTSFQKSRTSPMPLKFLDGVKTRENFREYLHFGQFERNPV